MASVKNQTYKEPITLLLIDDMARLPEIVDPFIQVWRSPWRLGVAHAFNMGIALAKTELVVMLGSDDLMEADAIERAVLTWEKHKQRHAYYYFGVRYMDTSELQTLPCGEAMVTKGLWDMTGGFPVESASGAPDAAFISIMLTYFPSYLIPIADGAPLINYRRHNESDTAGKAPWQGVILSTRDLLTRSWEAPAWTKNAPS